MMTLDDRLLELAQLEADRARAAILVVVSPPPTPISRFLQTIPYFVKLDDASSAEKASQDAVIVHPQEYL